MLREIRLYGELGRRFGRVHRMAVNSAAEAIRALCANFPDFESAVINGAPGYKVFAGRSVVPEAERLHDPVGSSGPIRIVPVVAGAKKGGFFNIIFGGLLIAASLFIPGLQGLALFGTTTLASVAFSVGVGLVIGGVAQLLTPTPKLDAASAETENKPSYVFNGPVNTTAQGHPVPIGYGELIIGSAVISAGLYTEELPT